MAISSADAIKAIAAIEKQLAALRVFAGMPAEAVAVKSKPAASTEKPESKRVLSPHIVRMNEERAAVFEELKEAWALANPDFASLDDKAYKLAVKNGEVEAKPLYSDALAECGRRSRADDPEKQAKYDAYRAKVEADPRRKKGNASVSSASVSSASSAPKPEPVADVKKPRVWSEAAKAKNAIKRAAKAATKAASVALVVAAPNPFDETPLPTAPAGAEIVEASADDEDTFAAWNHKDTWYWKNRLQEVYKMTIDKETKAQGFGGWAGRYDEVKKVILNEPEPAVV